MSGVFIFLLGIIVFWLEQAYGSFHQIPGTIKLVLYITIGVVSIGLALTKIKGILTVMKKYRENMSLMHLIQELYTRRVIMMVVPYIIAITVLVVYFSVTKTIEKRKTVTRVRLTQKGYEEFIAYLNTMEKIIQSVKE